MRDMQFASFVEKFFVLLYLLSSPSHVRREKRSGDEVEGF